MVDQAGLEIAGKSAMFDDTGKDNSSITSVNILPALSLDE